MTLRMEALRGVRWTTVSAAASVGAQLLQLVVLARLLPPTDFGLMGMVLVVIGFARAYTDLGISAAILHHQDVSHERLSTLYWLNVIAGVVVCGLFIVGAPLVTFLFPEPRLVPLLRVAAVIFLVVPLGQQFEILLQRDLRFDLLAKQEVIAAVLGSVAAIVAAFGGLGVWSLLLGTLVTAAVKAALLIAVGRRVHWPALRFRRADLKGFIGFGLYQTAEQAVSYFAQRLDQVVIGSLLGAQALGFYTFAFNLTGRPVSRINPIVTRVAFPVFCKIQDDQARLRRGFLQVVHLLTTVNAPLLIGLAAVAPVLVPGVFGPRWLPAVPLVELLSGVALLRSVGNPIGSLLLACGRADWGFRWNVFALAVTAPLVIAGARLGGLLGVAGALLAMQVVLYGVSYRFLVRALVGRGLLRYLTVTLRPVVLAAAMAAGVLAAGAGAAGLPPLPRLAVEVAVGALVYVALVLATERGIVAEFRTMLGPGAVPPESPA